MKDDYKISLEILQRILKDSGNNHWAKWITKDISEWNSNKNVDHHLRAYGGMGSINDLIVGGTDTIGVWKNKLFEIIKNLSWSLAKGKISKAPIDADFYRYGNNEISGWRCQNCGQARVDRVKIEHYLSTKFLPIIIVDLIKNEELENVIDLDNIINRNEINKLREQIGKQIIDQEITLTNGNEWSWTCPICESKDVCVYRWTYDEKTDTLIESDDNLKINKGQLTTMHKSNGGESTNAKDSSNIKQQSWWKRLWS